MDVRQFAFLAAQPSAALKPRTTFCGLSKRALALLLVNALFWQPIWAQAEGIAVSAGNGASLGQAGNGVPIVNIATPGANGLSHNQFQAYDVGANGVILNNATDRTASTQLGGLIVGNPNLKGQAAGIILNEVVGGSPSQLQGYTEVAGQAARVIVANPYGVTCNGCGFLNTPRVTLTTGKPVLDGNRLDHFQVDGGAIAIEGNGLNADNVEQFDLVTRSAKINAQLQAKRLNIIAGRNDVAADSLAATPRAASPGDAPQLAIDSSALGGMYAHTIRLVGTEAGVGVKLAGNLAASAGDIQLAANGQLTLAQAAASGAITLKGQGLDAQGPVYAGGSVTAQSSGDLSVRQSVAARDAITLSATGPLSNAGIVEAGVNPDNSRNATGDVSLQAAHLTNRGSVIASRTLTATVAEGLDNSGATLSAGSHAQLRAGALGNAGGLIQSRGSLDVNTGRLDNRQQGHLYGAGATRLTFTDLLNAQGVLASDATLQLSGGQVNNDGGQIGSVGTLTATLGSLDQLNGQFASQGQLTLVADRLANTGNALVAANGGLDLRVAEVDNRGGELSSQAAVSLTGQRLDNRGGKLIAGSQLTANVATLVNSDQGVLSAQHGLSVTGQTLANGNGGLLTSGGDLRAILSGALDNQGGQLLGEGSAAIQSASLDNRQGMVSSAGPQTLSVSGAVQNDGGQLVTDGGLTLASASLANGSGALSAKGPVSLVTGTLDNGATGQLLSSDRLTLSTTRLTNAGRLASGGDLAVTTPHLFNSGELFSQAGLALDLQGGTLTNASSGLITAPGALVLNHLGSVRNAGELSSSQAFTLAADSLDNRGGTLISTAGLTLRIARALENAQGTLSAAGLDVTAARLDNSGGTLVSRGAVHARIQDLLDNGTDGLISAATTLDLTTGTLLNQGGSLLAQGAATLAAGQLDNSAKGLINSQAGLTLNVDRLDSSSGGEVSAKGELHLGLGELKQQGGRLIGESALSLDLGRTGGSGTLDNRGGLISTTGVLSLQHLRQVSNVGGEISSAMGFDLIATALDNTQGKLISQGLLKVQGGALVNQGGLLSGWQGLTVSGTTLDNRQSGTLSSKAGDLAVTLDQALDNRDNGALVSQGGLAVTAARLANTGGVLSSGGAQSLTFSDRLDNGAQGLIDAGAGLAIEAGTLANTGGAIQAKQGLTVTGTTLDNHGGSLNGQQAVTLDLLGALANSGGAVLAQGDLLVKGATAVSNAQGRLNSGGLATLLIGSLDNGNGGTLAAQGTLRVTASGAIRNAADGLLASQGGALAVTAASLDNTGGTLQSATGLSVTAQAGDVGNVGGTLIAQNGDLQVTANSLDNRGGILASLQGVFSAGIAQVLRNGGQGETGGSVQAQRLDLTAGTLDNYNGKITALGGDALVAASRFDNRNGSLYGQGRVRFTGGSFDNSGDHDGQVFGNQIDFSLSGALNNRLGILESATTLSVTAASLDNTNGQLRALGTAGTTQLTLSGALDNTHGKLETANQNLQLAVGGLTNANGTLLHVGTGTFGLGLPLLQNAGGSLTSNGTLTLSGASWTNSSVLQVANLAVDVDQLTQTASGKLLASGTFTGTGGNWTNDGLIAANGTLGLTLGGTYQGAGQVSSGGNFTLNAGQVLLDNANARLTGGSGTTTFGIGGLLRNQGRITAAADSSLSAGQIENQGTLGAAGSLAVTTSTLTNENGLIFSGGDMGLWVNDFTNRYADVYSLGRLLIAHDAQGGRANSFANLSGSIESDGDLQLNAASILNARDVFEMSVKLVGGDVTMTCGQHCGGHDWFKRGAVYVDRTVESQVDQDSPMARLVSGTSAVIQGNDIVNRYSLISASQDLTILGDNLTNQGAASVSGTSRVQVGQDVKIPTSTWDERERDVALYHSAYGDTFDEGAFQTLLAKFDPALFTGVGTPVQVSSNGQYLAPAIIQAGGNVQISAANDISNLVVDRTPTASKAAIADTAVAPAAVTTTVSLNSQLPPDLAQQQVSPTTLPNFTLPTGQNGLFRLSGQEGSTAQASQGNAGVAIASSDASLGALQQTATVNGAQGSAVSAGAGTTTPDPSGVQALPTGVGQNLPHHYLVETNPALTDLKQFLSSDYLLGSLDYDPDTAWKRLGDGLYEQRLIEQAITARTGKRFLDGLASDEAQFKYLMDNALASKEALNLTVGVSLTAEQVAALTHDIVWMEDQVINGEHVLVPVLYLAQANDRLAPGGALIQGSDVTLIAGRDLNNAGTLRASNSLSATAGGSLVNSGLIQAGDRLSLTASTGDLTNRAGGLIAGRDVSLTAVQGDILNERTVTSYQTAFGANGWRADFADSAARIEAANDLTLQAGRDSNNVGGALSAGGNATLLAGRDVNLVSAQTQNSRSGVNFSASTLTQLGSSLTTGGNLTIGAGRDLTAVASSLQAGGNVTLAAQDNLTLAAAANESHSYAKSSDLTTQEDHVSQQATTVTAGGNVTLQAQQGDLTLVASKVESGGEAYLYAGKDLNVLAAQDSDYSLYDMNKKGSFGASKTQRDEVTDVRNVGSEIKATGDITLQSAGNQTYQSAKLSSSKDLTLDSGGDITFEAVKDLHQESHEKSGSSLAWQSAKGKGNTDEMLRQSELAAQGQLAIKAVQGLKIDIKEVNGQTVSQTIDAMVKADPNLAWIKQVEARGDIDVRQVKELHDSFKYSSSGPSGPAALAIAIVVAYFTAGAASTLIGNMAGAAAGSGTSMAAAGTATASAVASGATAGSTVAAGWANVALASVATSAASSAAVSAINNRGDLGAVLKEVTSSSALKGYVSTALTAGFTAGVLDSAFGVTGDNINKVTKGFDLSKVSDLGKFGAYLGAQGAVQAVTQTAIQGGSLGGSLQNALTNQLQHLLQAATFNAVGDLAGGKLIEGIDWKEGGPEKTALHALAGGLLNQAMGGDFATGALAAGANEVLVERLSGLIKGNKGLELAVSQLIGIAVATATGGDVNKVAELTKNATAYNRQLHPQEEKWLRDNAKRFAKDQGISEQEAMERLSQQALKDVDYLWRSVLSDGNDNAAQAFLSNSGQSFTNDLGDRQALFTASGQQLFRPEMFADTANAEFYREFVQSGVSRDLSTGVLKELKDSGIAIKDGAADLGKLLVDQPTAVLAGIWNGIKGLPESAYDSFRESGKAIGEGAAVAFNDDISSKLNAIYGLDVSTAQQTMLLVRTISAVAGAGTAGAAGNAGAKLTGKVAETVGKQLDDVLNDLASKALLKSGGAFGLDGKPLLDLKQLTNEQKGVLGELFGEQTIKKIVPDGQKLARSPGVGETGIDDLYKVNRADVDYVVIEYKFVGSGTGKGSTRLGDTADGKQGSESWLTGRDRIPKAVGESQASDIIHAIDSGRVESWVVTTRPDGSTIVEVLDSLGKPKNVDTSKLLSSK